MRSRGVAACAAALPALLMLRRAMGGGGPTRWLWLGARGTTRASRRPDGTNMARCEDRIRARTGSEQEQDQSKNKIRARTGSEQEHGADHEQDGGGERGQGGGCAGWGARMCSRMRGVH